MTQALGRLAVVDRAREAELLEAALASGANVVLEGPPGTGKSTLLRGWPTGVRCRSSLSRATPS